MNRTFIRKIIPAVCRFTQYITGIHLILTYNYSYSPSTPREGDEGGGGLGQDNKLSFGGIGN